MGFKLHSILILYILLNVVYSKKSSKSSKLLPKLFTITVDKKGDKNETSSESICNTTLLWYQHDLEEKEQEIKYLKKNVTSYKKVVEEIDEIILKEMLIPSLTSSNHKIKDNSSNYVIISREKVMTSILYNSPDTWGRCTRSCTIRRSWKCKRKSLCPKESILEHAYCYSTGSICEKKVKQKLEDKALTDDVLYYDYDDIFQDLDVDNGTSYIMIDYGDIEDKVYHYDYIIPQEDEYYNYEYNYDTYDTEKLNDTYNYEVNTEEYYTPEDKEYDVDVTSVDLHRKLKKGEGKCGLPRINPPFDKLRVIGGQETPRGMVPWQVAVFNKFKELICGGSLIAPNWILTAAHCIRKKLFVRLAEYDIRGFDAGEKEIKVEKAFGHPLYDLETINNDIALLKLPDDVSTRGKFVRTICLPERNETPPVGQKCVVAGWGKEKETHIFGSDILLFTQVPIVNKKVCKAAYPDHPISKNMFCAGYKKGGRDTCSGDSGGPLVCKNKAGIWKVHGVTSFGEGCGDKGKMGVYSRVHNFLPWIYHTMDVNE